MPPNETVQHAAVFDRAMLQAAEQLGYVGMMHDPLTRRRFRLPARMRGCGIRSRAWLAPIAFTACFVEAVEGMMGVTDAGLPALFEQLTDVFGVGSFAPHCRCIRLIYQLCIRFLLISDYQPFIRLIQRISG